MNVGTGLGQERGVLQRRLSTADHRNPSTRKPGQLRVLCSV